VKEIIEKRILPYREEGSQQLLEGSKIEFLEIKNVVERADIIFVPIQTPHAPKYEGVTRIPDERVDFDYTYLKGGMKSLSDEIERQGKNKVVVIISTVLPGTIRNQIIPLLGKHTKLCYNPFFIAMGTTMNDFLNPEYILFGVDDDEAALKAENFYKTLHDRPFYKTNIESAELAKVAYNTFISTKISFVNVLMELCHKMPGANVDEVTNALKLANKRLISTSYLTGGMGDGGGCHPRDNIALSWLARKHDLSFDFFDSIMMQREKQSDWLAELIISELRPDDELYIMGKSFKPETNITTGSTSILLANILEERENIKVNSFDPFIDEKELDFKVGVYFIGTKHPQFTTFNYPKGSIILDPWRYIPDIKGVKVIGIGS
jgi:UDPglucose 6-dehydrogenase